MADTPVRIAAFYCFVPLPDPAEVRRALLAFGTAAGLRGSIILAAEGFNGTVAGTPAAIDALVRELERLARGAPAEIKFADAADLPFGRFKVRVKREIVTLGVDGLDLAAGRGTYVAPTEWNALIDDPATLLVDTRNSYEYATGSFAGALDPGTRSFTEFPAWLEGVAAAMSAEERRDRPLAMFCTGGIRCEKSTALARSLGFGRVYHLQGGILAYLEQVPEAESRWQGDCFVFDERVAVGHGLSPGRHSLCRTCGMPVPEEAMAAHGEGCGGIG